MPKLTPEEIEESKDRLLKSWEENKGVLKVEQPKVRSTEKKSTPRKALDLIQRLIITKKR